MTRGRFITLEGGEGVGKSTQSARLAKALEALGHDLVLTREPGGTPGAEAIRGLLMDGDVDRWSARSEALLFAAARADHVERVIAPALARGDWVVCDRFVDSTRAYQGGAGGLDDAAIVALHDIGCGGMMPDRSILLTLDAITARQRVASRDGAGADRFASKADAYHAALSSRFIDIAASDPERWRVVDAAMPIDTVTAAILAHVTGA